MFTDSQILHLPKSVVLCHEETMQNAHESGAIWLASLLQQQDSELMSFRMTHFNRVDRSCAVSFCPGHDVCFSVCGTSHKFCEET